MIFKPNLWLTASIDPPSQQVCQTISNNYRIFYHQLFYETISWNMGRLLLCVCCFANYDILTLNRFPQCPDSLNHGITKYKFKVTKVVEGFTADLYRSGGRLNIKIYFTSISIPMLKMRHDRLICDMGIPVPGRTGFILRRGPGYQAAGACFNIPKTI